MLRVAGTIATARVVRAHQRRWSHRRKKNPMNRSLRLFSAASTTLAILSGSASSFADGTMGFEGRSKAAGEKFTSISYSVSTPRDAASGLATGRRQHKPVCVVRVPLATSGTLVQMLLTNEVVKSATFDTSAGIKIKLTNASVASYRLVEDKDLEEICFAFQGIEISAKGGPVATDSPSGKT
jgi:type VI secretion system secreted protein Hcp